MIEAFDVAVVGGGAAGCVVARRFAERGGISVVLLEAGPDARRETPDDWRDGWRLPTVPDWGFESEPDAAGATGRLRRGRLLGGTSWLTRFAVRGAATDFDAWADAGNPGWAYRDVLPAFRRLESDAEFGDRAEHGDRGPIPITRYPGITPSEPHAAALAAFAAVDIPSVGDLNAPDAVGVGRMPMSSRDGVRVTAVDAYLPTTLTPSGLTIRPDSAVASVEIDGSRAVGLRLADGSRVGAGRIVLGAGTYGSPTILMRSGLGPADDLRRLGLAVHADLPGVGSNLADHPGVEIPTGWQGIGSTGPILHSIATFRSAGRDPAMAPDLMFWIADPAGSEPEFTLEAVLLKPASRGTVRLRSADPADPPMITLPGVRDGADVDRLVEAAQLGVTLANRPEIRAIATDSPLPEPRGSDAWRRYVVENAYTIPHVVGTCAMGPAPDDGSVVNSNGSVHGIEGLSVVDASIIPDAPAGFPHPITIMVAEHLAERLGGGL